MVQAFPCNQCGLCCQNIGGIEELKELDDGNGVCRYLKDNLCSIYENRPEVCRVDVMYEKYYKHQMNWDAFVKGNAKVCQQLQRTYGLPEHMILKVE